VDHRYLFPAVDVATQRGGDVFSMEYANEWEARAARQAAELAPDGQRRPFLARRALAQGLAAVSRGSAHVVRSLDDVVADDLSRSLSAATRAIRDLE